MRNNPRGRTLIINNNKFMSLDERKGTEKDKEGLNILFTKLEFIVDIKEDKTKEVSFTFDDICNICF